MATSTDLPRQEQHDREPVDEGTGSEVTGERFTPEERRRFPGLVLAGAVLGVVVIVLAWILLGIEYGLPLLLLALILLVAAVGFRVISARDRDPAASEVGGLPAQSPDPRRPLGDTAEAHDEVNPHDFPLYSPARRTAARMSGGWGGTTRGMQRGAAAGMGGAEEGHTQEVDDRERGEASLETSMGPRED